MQEVAALRYGFRRRISSVSVSAVPVSSPGRTPGFFFALAALSLEAHDRRAIVAVDVIRRQVDPIADGPRRVTLGRSAQVEDQPLLLLVIPAGIEAIGPQPGKGSKIVVPVFRAGLDDVFHLFSLDTASESRNDCTILHQEKEIKKIFLFTINLKSRYHCQMNSIKPD